MCNAPKNYVPWYIRVKPNGKDPVIGLSWKTPIGRLSFYQALKWMENGGNVGLAGTPIDNLVNMDCDNALIPENEIKPTLMVKTRSRIGRHAFYWNFETNKIENISTDHAGEVRCRWQFVVCAGGYVPADLSKVPENEKENAGYYTVCNPIAPSTITYSELPHFFRDLYEAKKQALKRTPSKFDPKKSTTECSALFEVTARDVCLHEGVANEDLCETERWSSLFHDSNTEKNMSFSGELLHCWRHERSFNGLEALTVLSGYLTCDQAGSPHKNSVGESQVIGNNGAIFHAWRYAKQQGYIPKDDKLPTKAMYYIADKHLHFKADPTKPLPRLIYNQVLKIVERDY